MNTDRAIPDAGHIRKSAGGQIDGLLLDARPRKICSAIIVPEKIRINSTIWCLPHEGNRPCVVIEWIGSCKDRAIDLRSGVDARVYAGHVEQTIVESQVRREHAILLVRSLQVDSGQLFSSVPHITDVLPVDEILAGVYG